MTILWVALSIIYGIWYWDFMSKTERALPANNYIPVVYLASFHQLPSTDVILSLNDYPSEKLGYALDRMSIQGKYCEAPSGKHPSSVWKWQYELGVWPGVIKLLQRSGLTLEDEKAPENSFISSQESLGTQRSRPTQRSQ